MSIRRLSVWNSVSHFSIFWGHYVLRITLNGIQWQKRSFIHITDPFRNISYKHLFYPKRNTLLFGAFTQAIYNKQYSTKLFPKFEKFPSVELTVRLIKFICNFSCTPWGGWCKATRGTLRPLWETTSGLLNRCTTGQYELILTLTWAR